MSTPEPFKEVPHRGLITVALMLATVMQALDTTIANVALPTLSTAFAASFQAVQWVVLAYLLVITALIVSVGRLGDLVGRRLLLVAGLGL
ncbi:MAG: MFS transporter, partial [Mesorhizobium sp.]